jgi:pimeloyl-ACP methyl ester carboxylesterase
MFAIGVGANPRWCCSTIGAALLAPGWNSSTNSQIGTDRLPSTTAAGANLTHRLKATAFPISPRMRRASSAPWKSNGTSSLGTRWAARSPNWGVPAARRAWPTQAMLEDIRSDARLINVPTLVLSGECDQVDAAARLREELLPCIPDSQLQILSQVGHLPMLEAPDVVARAIRAFVLNL